MDGKQFGDEIVSIVRTFVERTVLTRLDALEKQISALPVPKDGQDADPAAAAEIAVQKLMPELASLRSEISALNSSVDPAEIKAIVAEAVAEIPVPKDGAPGAPGEPGKSVTVEDVAPLIEAAVEKRVAAIEVKDGRDGVGMAGAMIDREGQLVITMTDGSTKALGTVVGADGKSVTLDEVMPVITKAVADQISQIPIPKNGVDGKSVTVQDVLPVIEAEVAAAVAALPPAPAGQDGKSVTVEEVMPAIVAEIDARFAALPVPENGKDGTSVTLEDVAPIIEKAVAEKVAEIPVPQDGKSVDPAEVKAMVEETVAKAVADIPPGPAGKDGQSVSVADVEPVILAEVKRLVAEFPVPQDGKSVTLDEVAPVISAEVEKAVAKIPVPKDGLGMAGSFIDRDGNLIVTMTDGTAKELGPVVGRDGKDAELPDLSGLEEIAEIPDELNERIAKAVRLMAETPVLETAAAGYQPQHFAAPAMKTQPDIHVHMPEIKEMKVSMEAQIPPQEIVVKNELPPPRKTRTVVEEHDARGRVKKFRQEEIE